MIPDRRHCPRDPIEVPHFSNTRRPPHFYSAIPIPAAQEDEQVVVIEFAVAVEGVPTEPPGVA